MYGHGSGDKLSVTQKTGDVGKSTDALMSKRGIGTEHTPQRGKRFLPTFSESGQAVLNKLGCCKLFMAQWQPALAKHKDAVCDKGHKF
jgi:hypothetical protein